MVWLRAFTLMAALGFVSGCSVAAVSGSSGSSSSGAGSSTGSSNTSGSSSSASSSSGTSGSTSSTGSTGSTSSTSTGGGGPTVDALVGINGFIDDPQANLTAFGTVREYHDWNWDDGNGASGYPGYPNNQLQFSLWNGYWDFDSYYSGLADAGVLVVPAVQGSTDYLNQAMPPVPSGADPLQPASYAAHADFMFQMAARYGSVAVPDSELKLASDQVRSSGMGVLRYLENGNEPDNNWTHSDGSYLYTPEEFAAQSSADYDGDQGRMGSTFGVKNADPNMKMVLGGLAMAGSSDAATNATSYLDAIRAWADAHRGGDFPADVINFHHYCFGPDPYGTANPRPGTSPEDCGFEQTLAQMVAYRDQHLPAKEVWITEFGYDTDPGSNLRAPAIGANSAEVVQGQWLVRSVLAAAEAGVDRATIFVSRDGCTGSSCSNASVQFTTSGVTTDKNSGFTPKTAWFYLATFRKALGAMHFAGTRSSGNANVRIDAFADSSGGGAYVVWLPSSTAATFAGYSLAVPQASRATALALQDQSTSGSSWSLSISNGTVSVDLSETPLIVEVDRLP